MQTLVSADRKTSDWQRTENQNGGSTIVMLWLVFYLLVIGVAIMSPVLSDAIEVSAR
jgi:hypothetical protein